MRLFNRGADSGKDKPEAELRQLAIPRLDLIAPAGWLVKESLTVSAPDGLASLIVSSEPVEPSIDARDYADQTRDVQRRELPDYVELSFDVARGFGRLPAYLRRYEWRPSDDRRVSQTQILAVADGRGYVATATSPLEEAAKYRVDLDSALYSLDRIFDGAAKGIGPAEIESAMTSNGWTYQTVTQGAYLVVFRLPDGAPSPSVSVLVQLELGLQPVMIRISAQTATYFSQDRLYHLLRACNEWNRTRSQPVASVGIREDSGELEVFVEGIVPTGRDGRAGSLAYDLNGIVNGATTFWVGLGEAAV